MNRLDGYVNESLCAARESISAKLLREARCRLCGHSCRALTRHHLVPLSRARRQSFFGFSPDAAALNVPENIVPLCDPCHQLVEAKEKGGGHVHRARLRASLRADELRFVIQRAGQAWLDLRYPLAVEGDR